ncbi:AAA family ATPase, partial [Natrinema soli]
MVEANTQLLGGAAVTVFLALLFFGVVVLWDVALALRSVGDKIDKLEDNIDDDLTDIAHHLDGMSNARGGGGGTQLHLSGGTISSGPGPNQPQQAPQVGPQQAPQAGPQQAPQAGPQQASQTGHQQGRPTA